MQPTHCSIPGVQMTSKAHAKSRSSNSTNNQVSLGCVCELDLGQEEREEGLIYTGMNPLMCKFYMT